MAKSFVSYFDGLFALYRQFDDALMAKKTDGVDATYFNHWHQRHLCGRMHDPKEKGACTFRYRWSAHDPGELIIIRFRWKAVSSPEELVGLEAEDMQLFEMVLTKGPTNLSATIQNMETGEQLLVINEGNLLVAELDAFITAQLTIATVGIKRATKRRLKRLKDVALLPAQSLAGGIDLARRMGLIK